MPAKRPETGWGEMLEQFFRDGKVKVENHAQNGRSTRTFIAENRWQAIVDQLEPGDMSSSNLVITTNQKKKWIATPRPPIVEVI